MLVAAMLVMMVGCGVDDNRSGGDSDSDTDSDTDSDGDTDTGDPGYFGAIQGQVLAPAGFPISGALVYVTGGDGPEIEDHTFCYICDDMTGLKWTLSNADGTFFIDQIPEGNRNIVSRKGFYQRQRAIVVVGDSVLDVPVEKTTLPGEDSADGLDQMPNYAVLTSGPDYPEDMLAKMGLGSLTASGNLDTALPFSFHLYEDNGSPSIGATAHIFSDQSYLNYYHMIFFPCINGGMTAANNIPMLQAYVSSGGKIYSSCWASQWAEQPFPQIIEFSGDDNASNAGNIGSWDSYGTINDPEMREWLDVVAVPNLLAGESLDYYPFTGGWCLIDSLNDTAYDGHGVLDDGTIDGPVIPITWVTDVAGQNGHPLTITYNYDCGKVFYSAYQVVEYSTSTQIRAQEWVLIYLFFEVGVCEGDYVPPE
jgi:hypothetical protein